MEKIPLIAVVGPTASGKTALSIALCKAFDGEVVSADSMQIYRSMDIATAKPGKEEMAGIPHHMLDFLEPSQPFSVAAYCAMAHPIVKDIHRRGKMPFVVGGTGLYVDSLLNNIVFSEADTDLSLREELNSLLENKGVDYLLDELQRIDPESYDRLSLERNPKRIIRSIEVYRTTGRTQTELNREALLHESPYRALRIGLKAQDRQFLYDRADARVDRMLELGLIDEAQRFLELSAGSTASMAIGYKELMPYLNGKEELCVCVDNLKMQTRRYIKRQLTWFLRDESTVWFDIDRMSFDEICERSILLIKDFIHGKK